MWKACTKQNFHNFVHIKNSFKNVKRAHSSEEVYIFVNWLSIIFLLFLCPFKNSQSKL